MAVCLATSLASAAVAANAFTLAWTHSIERVRWEEAWRVEGEVLVLERVRVRGHGAGMEPAAGAVLRDGAWEWHPHTRHAVLRLTTLALRNEQGWADEAKILLAVQQLDRPVPAQR